MKILFKILRKIKILCVDFSSRLFSLHLHLGGLDNYPPVTYRSSKKTKFFQRTWSLLSDKRRIKFWSSVAVRHSKLCHFYSNDPKLSYENSTSNPVDYLCNLYNDGIVYFHNFFTNEDREKILEAFNNIDRNVEESCLQTYESSDPELVSIVNNKVISFQREVFGKSMPHKSITLQEIICKNNSFPFKASVHWHIDRFIPTFKFFYFPEEVKIAPLSVYKGSHVIDNTYIQNALEFCEINDDLSKNDYINFRNYTEECCYVPANTFIISCTHALHRRKPESGDASRKFITLNYYNRFTRYDLLKNIFNRNYVIQ